MKDNEQMLEFVNKCSGGDCVFFIRALISQLRKLKECPTLIRYFEEYDEINGEDDDN